MSMPFGEQRALKGVRSLPERLLFTLLGVPDPAHWLHFRYLKMALEAVPPREVSAVLDAGCGRGDFTFYLARRYPAAQIVGLDLDGARIVRNRQMAERLRIPNAKFRLGDLIRLSSEQRFDLIVSIDVLEHIPEQARALSNLFTTLRPGGVAFFHIPTLRSRPVPLRPLLKGFARWGEEEHVADDLTPEEFVDRVRSTGFEVAWQREMFGYFTGELATSLFMVPFRDTLPNRVLQGLLAPLCRGPALLDALESNAPRYAVAVAARKPRL